MTEVARTTYSPLAAPHSTRPDAFARARYYQAANDRYAYYDRRDDIRARDSAQMLQLFFQAGIAIRRHRDLRHRPYPNSKRPPRADRHPVDDRTPVGLERC